MLGLSQIRTFQHMKTHLFKIKIIHILTILVITQLAFIPVLTNKAISDTEKPASPDDGIVQLKSDMDLIELIHTASDINSETYILDESVKPQELNIFPIHEVSTGMYFIIVPLNNFVLRYFARKYMGIIFLNMNGLSVVKSNGINKVVSTAHIKEESTPTIIEPEE